MDGFIGEVKLFAGTFAPRNWAFCEGQLVSIAEHSALYSILGTQFGGDGRVNFGLPDLRGRVPVGVGTGPGLTPRYAGSMGGREHVALSQGQMPGHTHTIQASSSPGDQEAPSSNAALAAQDRGATKIYRDDQINTQLAPTGSSGSGQAHENMQPFCALHYIICLEGLYPDRP